MRQSGAKLYGINHTKLNEVKFQICEAIDRSLMRKQWTARQAAIYLGTSESCISRVRNRKVETLALGQLFRYLAEVEPSFRLLIAT